jgi:hypothetical protein
MDRWVDLVKALHVKGYKPLGPDWLEPCAGDGNIIRAVGNKEECAVPGWVDFRAVELREECHKLLADYVPKSRLFCPRNFFDYAAKCKTTPGAIFFRNEFCLMGFCNDCRLKGVSRNSPVNSVMKQVPENEVLIQEVMSS